ncbi:arginine/lysine/ornithine decarboxylase [Fontibacillus solani]|uniref:Arginine/lysine/ornithine decarboxylase n=1 Tax=Fontibacillus solani TaxID=1572857 RepID=A0A7W3XTG9_9BACL|nr:aminotransferase class I/II-fold pyridoxal phosphate-dependent enzyme [Fontibacillus solani]MBA9087590.1 arginine/lysine/ornithine decarboxylase [Fontibacillus solani]
MTERKFKAPLFEALRQYKARKDASFHVPGHKDGQAYPCMKQNDDTLTGVMEIDTTEITGTDDLHHPEGVIREAQELAADLFGAEETFFLVGGSTAGNLALILSVCTTPGDVLLVQRNVHKSVIHGFMLANANAVFLEPQQDASSGLMTIPSEETVREALHRYPDAKGLLVTSPNYYGMGASLFPLAKLCHANGVPLLVDEAHGAHYGLHPDLPKSALEAGADGVVQSTHKMLTAMTMGAMLHVQGNLLNVNVIRQRLAMVQSSSPSYPIMVSLDLSRGMIQSQGSDFFTEGLALVEQLIEGIGDLQRIHFLKPGASGNNDAYSIQDPFKFVLYDEEGQWSGYKLQETLEAEGCIPEMSDDHYVVLALSSATSQWDIVRLLNALRKIDHLMQVSTWNIENKEDIYDDTQKGLDIEVEAEIDLDQGNSRYAEAVSDKVHFDLRIVAAEEIESVRVEECEGRQAAEMVIPYPPGIPILYPGEPISARTANQLVRLKYAGAKCQGTADPTLTTIQVHRIGTAQDGQRQGLL